MKIELQNLQYNEALSQETPAFTASLIINGEPRGTVRNNGTGGGNFYSDPKIEREINAYAKTLPLVNFDGIKFHETAETLIFGLVYDAAEVAA